MSPPRVVLASALLSILPLALGRVAFAADPQAPRPAPEGQRAAAPRFADHEVWSRAIGQMKAALGSGELGKAEDRALTVLREAAHFSADDPRLKATQEAVAALAAQERAKSRAEYGRFAETSLQILEREAGPSHPLVLRQLADLGTFRQERGENRPAAAHFEEIRKRTQGDGANATFWIGATIALAEIELRTRNLQRAKSLAAEGRELATRVFGPENQFVFTALVVESRAARMAGRRDEAARDLSRALGIVTRVAPNHPKAALARLDYGTLLLELCRHDEAKREIQSAADGLVATLGSADPTVVDALGMLATAERLRGDWPAARPVAERALGAAEDHALRAGADAELPRRKLIETRARLAEIDLALDRNGEAKALLERARSLRGVSAQVRDAELGSLLALAEAALGNAAAATHLAEEALRAADAASVPPLAAADVRVRAAEVFVRTGDFPRAESLASRAIPSIEPSIAPAERLLRALRVLAQAQAGSGKREAALDTLGRARSVGSTCFGATSPLLEPVARDEAELLAALGRSGEEAAARSRAEAIAARAERGAATAGSPERLEEAALNFALRPPPPPWAPIAPVPGSSVTPLHVFARAEPSMQFGIIAHDSGAPADIRDEEVLARALDNFGATKEGIESRLISRKERVIHGIPGVQLLNRLSNAERTWYDVNWFGSHGGIVYWLLLSSDQTTPDALAVEAQTLFEGLSVLDPTRVASPLAAPRTFHSERFGYSLDLAGTNFVTGDRRSWPERVEFAAALPSHDPRRAVFLVVPVSLAGITADPDLVDAALCSMIEPNLPDCGKPRSLEAAGARGREYDARLPGGEGPVSYRVRVFQRGEFAVAAGVVAIRAPQAEIGAILDAAARVRLDQPFTPPAPQEPSERERLRQSLFMNALGIAYVRAGRFAESIAPFERTVEIDPSQVVTARNLAEARFRAGRARDAVEGLNGALARFPKDPALLGWRGLAHAALGEHAAAAGDLGQAIELGNAVDEIFAIYVVALVRLQRIDEALAALGARIEQTNSPGARALRTAVLRRAGRSKEAIAELRALSREHPTDLAIQGAMADAAIEAGDPATFLEATEEFAGSDDQPGPLILYLRALAQKNLGRYDDAIESLDRVLSIAPDSQEIRALRDRFEAERRGGQST